MRKKALPCVLVLVIIFGIIINPLLSTNSLALESTGNSTFDAFINDPRWTQGASYGNRGPYISPYYSESCCAYTADFAKYCYNSDTPFPGDGFTNASELQAGDTVRLGDVYTTGKTHYFVVLKRSGNSLYTAEGNIQGKCRIGWNYSISGTGIDTKGLLNQSVYPFKKAFHLGTPINVNQSPIGCIDACEIRNGNQIFVGGWAFDPSEPSKSIQIHMYLNNSFFKTIDANGTGDDVNTAYGISGKHRFSAIFDSSVYGDLTVDLYAIDTQGGSNPLLGDGPNKSTRFQLHIHDPYSGTSCSVSKAPTTSSNGTLSYKCPCGTSTTFTIPKLADAKIRDGLYRILSTNGSGLYVSVTPNQLTSLGNIALYGKGSATQQFTFKRNSDSTYTISTGSYVLDVDGAQFKGNVQLFTSNGSDAQKWYVTSWNNGYRIVNKAYYLNMDINGNGTAAGTNIHTWVHNGSVAQTFKLELVECANHTWNSGVVTKQPAIGVTGIKTYTCTACGKTKQETIPALVNNPTATPKPTATVTPKPTATTTPKPTAKPVATATPKPTSKPVASATPKPTTKPVATATPKPISTVAVTTAPTTAPAESSPAQTDVSVTIQDTVAVGTEFTFDGNKIKITSDKTAEFVQSSDDSIVKVPATAELNGKSYIVTSIADKAFMNNKNLTQIIIGKNVTKIGDNAFYGCKKLKTVSGGENVKTIGFGAFMECPKLKLITIGPKVTSIGASAFQGNKSLKKVIVKSKKLKAKKVGANAFKGIAKKAVFKIPKSKAKIYKPMFKKVSKGTKISFKKI